MSTEDKPWWRGEGQIPDGWKDPMSAPRDRWILATDEDGGEQEVLWSTFAGSFRDINAITFSLIGWKEVS